MKKSHNYQPWNVSIPAFPRDGNLREQILFLLHFPILAPSGHNSQPWQFHIKENVVSIRVNEERSLSYSDPKRRQLLIAMGCALENLLIAADYYGFDANVNYFPNAGDHNLVVNIALRRTSSAKWDSNHLIFSIPERRTNRNKFTNRLPPEDFELDSLALAVNWGKAVLRVSALSAFAWFNFSKADVKSGLCALASWTTSGQDNARGAVCARTTEANKKTAVQTAKIFILSLYRVISLDGSIQ